MIFGAIPLDTVRTTNYDHDFDSIAGIFADRRDAELTLQTLRATPALQSARLVLLEPADAARRRFRALAQQWSAGAPVAGRGWSSDRWLWAALGGLLAAVLSAFGLLLSDGLSLRLVGGVIAGAALAGALSGALLTAALVHRGQHKTFNRTLRRKLAGGAWVVVAHEVPQGSRGNVSALIRSRSLKWCVVSSAQQTQRL
jgi:hypothetical protein